MTSRARLQGPVRQGQRLIQPAKDEAWGQTTAYVADPEGYLVEICSPVAGVPTPD